jgi:HEAT repeat protein
MKAKVKNKKAKMFTLICVTFAFFAFQIFAQQNELTSLSTQINNGTIEEKRNALYRIRNLNTADASRIAVTALNDAAEIVRATATHSILAIPNEEAAQILLPLLKDKSAFVREETAYALGKTGSKLATDSLILLLQKDKSDEVRGASAYALGLIADEKAFDSLVISLNKKNDFIQRSAARSLGQIGDKRAIPILGKIIGDSKRHDDVKREASESLKSLTTADEDVILLF